MILFPGTNFAINGNLLILPWFDDISDKLCKIFYQWEKHVFTFTS